MMAAYLVGTQGKFYHAAALGLAFTLTHTGTVAPAGVGGVLRLTQSAGQRTFFPIFELASGVMILVLGGRAVYSPFPGLAGEPPLPAGTRPQARPADRKRKRAAKKRLLIQQPIKEIGPAHSHTPSSVGYIPSGAKVKEINWRSLLTLGISGGLVPCPDAIAILLVALSINRIPFGISLIAMFSLGLATVLIGIGILVVESKRLFQRLRWFDKVSFIMPLVSSVIVVAIGAVLTVKVFRNFTPDLLQIRETQPAQTSEARSTNILYYQLNKKQPIPIDDLAACWRGTPNPSAPPIRWCWMTQFLPMTIPCSMSRPAS